MASLFQFLMSAIGPLVIKALVALGIGLITVKGVDVGMDALINQVRVHANGLPSDMAAIAGRFGLGTGLGMIFGACSFVVSYLAASKAFSFFGVTK